jgi:hypothetical protein
MQNTICTGDPFGRAWQRGVAGLLCRATCSGVAGVPCWPAVTRGADVDPGLPRHMHPRGKLATPPRLAQQRWVNRAHAAPFLPPPPLSLLSQPRGRAAPNRPPDSGPKSVDLGWEMWGKSFPASLWRYSPTSLPLSPLHYVDRRICLWPRVSSKNLKFRRNAIWFNVNDD